MTEPFRRFVILAGMRTGSNLLESTLNRIRGVTCFGEAFNPYMLGWPDTRTLRGLTLADRETDPHALLARLWDKPDHLPGFRYFHDHDPRVLPTVLDDRACAKIVLRRNPLDRWISVALARSTNQWKLNETETPLVAQVPFDAPGFLAETATETAFEARIARHLQMTGQTAFWIGYDDLRDTGVLTGLLHWLGRTDLARVTPASDQVPQNPRAAADKVDDPVAMRAALAAMDPWGIDAAPAFEPVRGPAVPTWRAAEIGAGLLAMPIRGGPTRAVTAWLAARGTIAGGLTRAAVRGWKQAHPGHRAFTVIRDPLHRAWAAFAHLHDRADPGLRSLLTTQHRVPPWNGPADSPAAAPALAGFLDFLRRNLHGQTSVPPQPHWASQTETLAGFIQLATPDAVLREARLPEDLRWLAAQVGAPDGPAPALEPAPDWLDDPALRRAARAAYARDYAAFGLD